jgi:stearoyl-CoA desaturase (Delta-9 desaturase)
VTDSGSASSVLADDVQPVENETRDRIITGFVTGLPIASLIFVAWQAWGGWLHWRDIVIFLVMYLITGLGITVGFHRLFTHRSFKTGKTVRFLLAAFGSAAIEGPIISWVADHRKHHVYSDQPGDPHSPHVDHGHGWSGAFRGLLHAHVGWLFLHTDRGLKTRYAPDLIRDPVVSFVNRTFLLWATVGLVLPLVLGYILGGTLMAALTGLLWGGFVRMLVVHHVTFSINSLCHFFGRRAYDTEDQSRNLAWLAPFTLGEAWHNNHHAFPTAAFHGMRRWQIDPSAWVIRGLAKVGLAWDIVQPSAARQAAKAIG